MGQTRPRIGIYLHVASPYFDQLRRGIGAYHQLQEAWDFLRLPNVIDLSRGGLGGLREFDGLIVSLVIEQGDRQQRLLEAIVRSGRPAVDVSQDRWDLRIPQVQVDDVAVGGAAAEYLLGLGFSTFGFIGLPLPFSRQRLQGFSEVLATRNASCLIPPQDARWWDQGKQSRLQRPWFRSVPKPIAVLAATDALAAAAIENAQAEGVLVPDHVAVMGVDNSSDCELYRPTITSIPLDGVRAGFEAGRLLHRLMDGAAPPAKPILIPPLDVVARGSTDSLAIADPEVIAAVRFIREHAASPMSTSEIVEHVALSRSTLERRFRAVLHRSIGDEVRRVQTRRATDLLRRTRLSIEEVAEKSGFGSGSVFTRIFSRVIGCTPSAYRRQATAQIVQAAAHRDPAGLWMKTRKTGHD